MSETPNLHIRREGGAVVASLRGEIDIVNAAEISDGLFSGIDGAESVVVDLDGVSFMDSQGVALLDRLASRLDAGGSAIAVVARPGSIPRRVLEIVDLGLPLYDDADAAATALSARSIASAHGPEGSSPPLSPPIAGGSPATQA
jgi:anti-anti-sigma factor